MIGYFAFDTCVWIDLLKTSLIDSTNEFDMVVYGVESGQIKLITCDNLIREWNRVKARQLKDIVTVHLRGRELLKKYQEPNPDDIEEQVLERMDKIDQLLATAILARETDEIRLCAVQRNLDCLPPNHSQDSFRDTINILTIIHHLIANPLSPVYFVTINHADFSKGKNQKSELHDGLEKDFAECDLVYLYYSDNYKENLVFNKYFRPLRTSFEDYLKERRKKVEEAELAAAQVLAKAPEVKDEEFIRHLNLIDLLTSNPKPSNLELKLLNDILDSRPEYKQYFLQKVSM